MVFAAAWSGRIEFLQPVAVQQCGDCFDGHLPTDEVALYDLAAKFARDLELFPGFHALGDGAEIQSVREGKNRADERLIDRGVRDVLKEALIYSVRGEPFDELRTGLSNYAWNKSNQIKLKKCPSTRSGRTD